ncbi:hypothetical protein Metfor_2248 [Methanoregula formicica SMSP]|uniref:Uncharacterized protein n=1 Tax=Methanoregula formicica (strain DSM 22288 / NBRC 105244 / SMSP) TaxID=593750 RepID=L0HIX5_METFS|nr:hypothetical protein Metfor_2248 [Methanoregula formicica SMSP]
MFGQNFGLGNRLYSPLFLSVNPHKINLPVNRSFFESERILENRFLESRTFSRITAHHFEKTPIALIVSPSKGIIVQKNHLIGAFWLNDRHYFWAGAREMNRKAPVIRGTPSVNEISPS